MNNFRMDKRKILQRISCGLQWENKLLKLKRSTANNLATVSISSICKQKGAHKFVATKIPDNMKDLAKLEKFITTRAKERKYEY